MARNNINKDSICVFAGMPRSGSTFLYYTLAKHPDIFVPSRKEIDFFSVNNYRGLKWYFGFFRNMGEDRVGIDISPMYFMDKNAPGRIFRFNKNAKVVLMVRDPLHWIISLYKHLRRRSYKSLGFESFLHGYQYKKDSKSLHLEFHNNPVKSNIETYQQMFGPNLLLCDFEIFKESPLPVLKAIEKFMNLKPYFDTSNFENIKLNASDQPQLKLFNILMHQKFFVDLVTLAFSKSFIMSIRYKIEAPSNNSSSGKPKISFTEKELSLANELLGEDIKYVSNLFADCRILRGLGAAFDQRQENHFNHDS